MDKNPMGSFNWAYSKDNISKILGDDFWNDINDVLPKRGPSIDVYQTQNEFCVVIEAPGISSPDMINIKLKGSRLVINGNIPYTYPVPQDNFIRNERFFGEFKRQIDLPEQVSLNCKVNARSKNGLIEIRIPRDLSSEEKNVNIQFNE